MGRKSTFIAAHKRDAVIVVISKRKTMAETNWELGIFETTFTRCRDQALESIEAALADNDSRHPRASTNMTR